MKSLTSLSFVTAVVLGFMFATRADCPRCVKATLDFSGSNETIRVDLYASPSSFDVCSGTGKAKLLQTQYVLVDAGQTICRSRTLSFSPTVPAATIYYQVKATTLGKGQTSRVVRK